MSNQEKSHGGLTRRAFIKGSAVGAVGVASASILAGCGLGGGQGEPQSTPETQIKVSFETPPPPIPEKDIKETVTTDVLVVGAGTGGMFAALAAAESGAKTILLEKGSTSAVGPGWMAAVNSSLQKKLGVKIDRDEIVAEICRYGGHLVDQRIVSLWADKSGEVMDWFMPIVEAAGMQVVVETDIKEGFYKSYPVAHIAVAPDQKAEMFPTGGIGSAYYIPILVKKAQELGVDIRYSTPLVQLIREEKGRVTGAIAKNEKGEYVRFNTNKGVILCTGGYARDAEMVEKLCPTALATSMNVCPPTNTGDGIKAALWVGAAMDPTHAMMVFDRGVVLPGKKIGPPWQGGFLQLGSQPFLRVNTRGERFVNEDLPYDYAWDAALMEPGQVWWQVWDANWKADVEKFHTTICSRIITQPGAPPRAGLEIMEADINKLLEMNIIKKADTIEALAEQMGVPVATFKATVERYNQLTKQGKDEDFGKVPFRMSTLEHAPYYAANLAGMIICNLNGLRINTNLQVLDQELNPIPGLYAAGNDSGSFFALNYPEMLGGLALGRTATFGRLAGLAAAQN